MRISSEKPPILKAKCSKCGHNIVTQDYSIEGMSWTKWGRHIFCCDNCGAQLTMSPDFYKYLNITIGYFFVLVLCGGIATFIISDPMHVTFAMLVAGLGFIPLIVLAAINRKAVPVGDD
jgi:hypothetical protein